MAVADDKNTLDFQVASPGLLGFLRLKGGVGPRLFGLRVDPSIDVTDFYGVDSTVTTVQTGAAAAIGTGVQGTATVQPRRYLAVSGNISIGAAAGTWLTLAVGFGDGLGNSFVVQTLSLTPIIGGVYRIGAELRGLVLPSGYAPQLRVDGNAGGADHVAQLQYAYQRLDGLP